MRNIIRKAVLCVIVLAMTVAFTAVLFSSAQAVSVGLHDITFVSHTYDPVADESTWIYQVTSASGPPPGHAISHWVLAWCHPEAMVETDDPPWEYVFNDLGGTGITGIKFDHEYDDGEVRTVSFVLRGDYPEGEVQVGIKAGQNVDYGYVTGPVYEECLPSVPEFTTPSMVIVSLATVAFVTVRRRFVKTS